MVETSLDSDLARGRFHDSGDQLEESGLSGTILPQNAQGNSLGDLQIEVSESTELPMVTFFPSLESFF
jgi:hypothetical protein